MIAIDTLQELDALHPIGSYTLAKTRYQSTNSPDGWDCVLHFYGECVIGYGSTAEQAMNQAIVKREHLLATKRIPISSMFPQ